VIEGFMAQNRRKCPIRDMEDGFVRTARAGTGGSSEPDLAAEFSSDKPFERGTVG